MATSLLRKRRLQAPFVVTVAAAATALLPGCGGKSATQPSSGDGGAQCPPDRPAAGSPCSGNLVCGDPCSASYGPVECVNGTWMEGAGGCNPPATVCPSTEPAPGTSCTLPGQTCGYPDACTSMTVTFGCVSGVWQGTGAPDGPVACPASVPASGSSCAACAGRWPSECDYGPTCNGFLNTAATCDAATGTWSISVGSCNPPQSFDGGPPDAADDGPSDAAVDAPSDGPSE